MTIKSGLTRALGAAGVLALMAPAAAFAGDRVGTLQCKLQGNGLTVLVENQQVDCNYRDSKEGAEESLPASAARRNQSIACLASRGTPAPSR